MLAKPELVHWVPPRGLPLLERVSDYVLWHSKRNEESEAIVFNEQRLTYVELQQQIDACAKALLAVGVKKGDRIATLSTPRPDYLVSFLASASIGAIWLGLNPKYQLEEYRHIVSDAQPMLIFAYTRVGERSYTEVLQTLRQENSCIEHIVILNRESSCFEGASYEQFIEQGRLMDDEQLQQARADVKACDSALLVYTSGSTGKPKGALLSHHGLVKCALVHREQWDIDPVRCINFFPVNHVGCVSDTDCYALIAGGTIVYLEKFSVESWLGLIQKEKVTFWMAVPTSFQMALNHPGFANYDLSSIQLIGWGGGAMPRDCVSKLERICPQMCNIYGLTETTGNVTFVYEDAGHEALIETVGKPAGATA